MDSIQLDQESFRSGVQVWNPPRKRVRGPRAGGAKFVRTGPDGGAIRGGIAIAIIDEHKRSREAVSTLIGASPGFRVIGRDCHAEEAIRALQRDPADVLLMNIGSGGPEAFAELEVLRTQYPALPVLILSESDQDDVILKAVSAGVCGYLLKGTEPAKLLDGIREAHGGGAPLSPEIACKVLRLIRSAAPRRDEDKMLSWRELEILQLLSRGHSYKTTAAELYISPDTVRFHVRRIYSRLGAHSNSEAVIKAIRHGVM
jgi:DNA-binding NarL/FixJ family response regulator